MSHPERFSYPHKIAQKLIGFFTEKHAGIFPKLVNGYIMFLYCPNGQQEDCHEWKVFCTPNWEQQRILDAAYQVFFKCSYKGVSLSEIASNTGISNVCPDADLLQSRSRDLRLSDFTNDAYL